LLLPPDLRTSRSGYLIGRVLLYIIGALAAIPVAAAIGCSCRNRHPPARQELNRTNPRAVADARRPAEWLRPARAICCAVVLVAVEVNTAIARTTRHYPVPGGMTTAMTVRVQ
jgi:hypothetical protein